MIMGAGSISGERLMRSRTFGKVAAGALDVGEVEAFVVQRDVRAVFGPLSRRSP
jgi:hypothetical protein